MRKVDCEKVIRGSWEAADEPDYFDRLFGGIGACQLGLRQWASDTHTNPRKHIEQLRARLSVLFSGPQTEHSMAESAAIRAELERRTRTRTFSGDSAAR